MGDHSDIDHTGLTGVGGAPAESDVTFTDITTNNASTSKHGYLKKLDNNAAHYMDGTGAWSTPASGAPTFIGWDIYNSGNISLSNGSETSITFNSERTSGDSSSFHDTGSNTHLVTIPSGKDGWYLVGAMSDLTSSAGAGSYIAIIKNGTSYIATGPIVNVAGYTGGNVTRLVKLVATDTLQVKILANAGSKNALAAADYSPEFWGVLVGV